MAPAAFKEWVASGISDRTVLGLELGCEALSGELLLAPFPSILPEQTENAHMGGHGGGWRRLSLPNLRTRETAPPPQRVSSLTARLTIRMLFIILKTVHIVTGGRGKRAESQCSFNASSRLQLFRKLSFSQHLTILCSCWGCFQSYLF